MATYLLQEEVEWIWETILNEHIGSVLDSIQELCRKIAAGEEPTQGDLTEAEWVITELLEEATDFKEAFAVWVASLIFSDLAEHFSGPQAALHLHTRKTIRNKLLQTAQGEQ